MAFITPNLAVCRDHGVFDDMPVVQAALRKEGEHEGRAAAPRVMADTQPPTPAVYSSLRDKDLPVALATVRGLTR